MFEVPPGAKAWLVIFHRHSTWWVEAICPGRFKHVSLAGFVPEANVWIVVSWELARMRVGVVADAGIDGWLAAWAGEGAGILRMKAPEFDFGRWRPRIGLFCISAAAHVLGARSCGALWPSAFWHCLIAQGAEIVHDATESQRPEANRIGDGGATGSRARAA